MTCVAVIGTDYIKTSVNVKHGIGQLVSVAWSSVFVTSIRHMIALLYE